MLLYSNNCHYMILVLLACKQAPREVWCGEKGTSLSLTLHPFPPLEQGHFVDYCFQPLVINQFENVT